MRVQDKRSGIHVVVHCGRVPSRPALFDVFILCFAGQSSRGRDKRHWDDEVLNSIRVHVTKAFSLSSEITRWPFPTPSRPLSIVIILLSSPIGYVVVMTSYT